MRNANNIFVGRPEGKRPLEKPRHTWDGYIRMDLRETVWEGVGLDSSGSGYGPVAGGFWTREFFFFFLKAPGP